MEVKPLQPENARQPIARHAVRDGDAGQATAILERQITDARHAVRDCDRSQAAAIPERTIADPLCIQAQGNTCNECITVNNPVADIMNSALYFYHTPATVERIFADARHAVRDGDGG